MFNTNTAVQKDKSQSISNKFQADVHLQHPQATPYSRHPSVMERFGKDPSSSILHCRVRGKGRRIAKNSIQYFVYLL